MSTYLTIAALLVAGLVGYAYRDMQDHPHAIWEQKHG